MIVGVPATVMFCGWIAMRASCGSFSSALGGVNTPELQQADNDYAVGLLLQAVANSPYAKDTLIIIIEDDSQDGADHVHSHRATTYFVGLYVKQHAIVSTRYSQTNVLRTIVVPRMCTKTSAEAFGGMRVSPQLHSRCNKFGRPKSAPLTRYASECATSLRNGQPFTALLPALLPRYFSVGVRWSKNAHSLCSLVEAQTNVRLDYVPLQFCTSLTPHGAEINDFMVGELRLPIGLTYERDFESLILRSSVRPAGPRSKASPKRPPARRRSSGRRRCGIRTAAQSPVPFDGWRE